MRFCFVIPLKTTKVFEDNKWVDSENKRSVVLLNLLRTLKSIDNAASAADGEIDVNVFISGHENPLESVAQQWKSISIYFVENSFPRPADKSLYMKDKELKKSSAFATVERFIAQSDSVTTFLMLFDADDLVSRDFFNYVLSTFERQKCDDIAIMAGYLYDYKNKRFGYLDGRERIFYRNCGSSFVSKIRQEDLQSKGFIHRLKNHIEFHLRAKEVSRNVYYSFDSSVLYLVNHGENDVSERHGEYHMVHFVKHFKCSLEEASLAQEKFPLLVS
ncbi:hypothetical protein [Alteromonas mediterranea]